MIQTSVDYTILFRELSSVPDDISGIATSFYNDAVYDESIVKSWTDWLASWKRLIHETNPEEFNALSPESRENLSKKMKQVNPKYILREWFLVPAYKKAEKGDYSLVKELQELMTNPYAEHSAEIQEKYYREKPAELFDIAGVSHVSCSS